MKITTNKFAELRKLKAEDLLAASGDYSKACGNAAERVKKLGSQARSIGKIIAAAMVCYSEAANKNLQDRGTTFEAYHLAKTGFKPEGKAMQCAHVYNALVITGKMSEEKYDKCAGDWIQTMAVTIKAKGGDVDTAEVKESLKALDLPVDEVAKKLRDLKTKAQGKEKEEKDENEHGTKVPLVINPETAIGLLRAMFAKGLHSTVVGELFGECANAGALDAKIQKDLVVGVHQLVGSFENCGIEPARIAEWLRTSEPMKIAA